MLRYDAFPTGRRLLRRTPRARPVRPVLLSLAALAALSLPAAPAVAEAQVDVTESQVDIARASGLPQLRVTSGYTRVYESARGTAVGRFFSQPNTYTVAGNLSQTLFQGG